MSASPMLRPTFKEGQILGAADLNAQVEYERKGSVFHERTEHLWGVAQGLTLDTTQQKTTDPTKPPTKYVDVTLAPGRAVDRLGRSILVTEGIPLDPDMFTQQIASPTDGVLYPVFVQAIEVARTGETQPGKCSVSLETRVEESLQIAFGSPGEEITVLDQAAVPVSEGFGTPALSDKVLVGWVKFNTTIKKFDSVATESSTTRIRYVGVVASDVVAGGGVLTLHTRPEGARFAVAITENSLTGKCTLEFGKQDGNGPVVPVLTVDEKGNIEYKGTLTPAPLSKTLAESGVISDGIKVPLPPEVDEDKVNQGTIRLHAHLTPIPQAPKNVLIGGALILAYPLVTRCVVDIAGDRVVHCQVRWYDPANPTTKFVDLPGLCSYTVFATGK
ncbi:MAG TPA: hypothetical protein VFV99_22755 [Kofleriaceae bacterium]|nr:hypothetical protein [Kofleriaceae bacterium]